MYYALFDEQGNRLASYHTDIHTNIPSDAIEISDEDQARYATNEYIRGADGKPQLKPAHIPTAEEIQNQLTDAVQRHMDTKAQSLGYDNLLAAVTYADEPTIPKFQQEGIAFRAWRSQVWDFCYAYLDEVNAGTKSVPTAESLISDLDFPVLTLP